MLEGGNGEGGRQGDKDRQEEQEGEEGGKGGRETPMLSARHGYAQKHASGC